MRIISSLTVIPDIELLNYANNMVRKTNVDGLNFTHVPTAAGNFMGHKINLNKYGHRDSQLVRPNQKIKTKIYFMGNSITLGWGVGQRESYPAVASEILNRKLSSKTHKNFVAINAGVANFNFLNSLALFKRDLNVINPDAVIFQYYPRDAKQNSTPKYNFLIKYTYLGAFFSRRIIGILSSKKENLPDNFKRLHQDGNPMWEKTKSAIMELKSICESRGLPLAVVVIPELRDPRLNSPFAITYVRIKKFLKKIKIPIIDPGKEIAQIYSQNPKKGWAHPLDPHPNADIHRIIGEEVFRYFAQHQFVF